MREGAAAKQCFQVTRESEYVTRHATAHEVRSIIGNRASIRPRAEGGSATVSVDADAWTSYF